MIDISFYWYTIGIVTIQKSFHLVNFIGLNYFHPFCTIPINLYNKIKIVKFNFIQWLLKFSNSKSLINRKIIYWFTINIFMNLNTLSLKGGSSLPTFDYNSRTFITADIDVFFASSLTYVFDFFCSLFNWHMWLISNLFL